MYPKLNATIEGGIVELWGPCAITGERYSVKVPAPRYHAWRCGMAAQDAFPDLSVDDREFLISGTSPEGWKQLYGDETEDDGDAENLRE